MATYGRNRDSIADIEQELNNVFKEHPTVTYNAEGEPIIPGDTIIEVLRTFSRNHDFELLDPHEEEMLNNLVVSNPEIDVTPNILLQFIALRTTTPQTPARDSPDGNSSPDTDIEYEEEERGRRLEYEDDYDEERGHSRSSSRDSVGTSVYYPGSRPPSRPPSRGPPVPPKTPTNDSPFDTSRRQRAAPLKTANAPSSWTRRPPPPTRRKSDASQHGRSSSDSESMANPPSAFNRGGGGRSRAPSNPTSPSTSFSTFSPPSRPHSRAQSQPQNNFPVFGSPEREYDYDYDYEQTMTSSSTNGRSSSRMGMISPPPSDTSFENIDSDDLVRNISSLLMPTSGDPDLDSAEDDIEDMHLIQPSRSVASSTASLDLVSRVDALQKLNQDLGKKLIEAENTLQGRLSEHEFELEELHSKLEGAKNELSATKREEKELRAKERTNSTQISALESEVVKLQKSLENARTSYQSLQKQYQEQCHESERYRDILRRRDEEIKIMKEQHEMTALEAQKLASVAATYEAQIEALHQELESAQQAVNALDEQKQENMFLKETIDRMRYDMDEMRTSSGGGGPGSGAASIRGSVSKSLGAELLGKMKWQSEDDAEYVTSEPEDGTSEDEEEEIEEIVGGDETESEDVIQTIITRTKRKIGSRARKIETVKINELKEYSDAAIQHEISEFTHSMNVQTDPEPKPITRTFSVQTEGRSLASMDIQTDPEPVPEPIVRVEMDIQTEPEPEPEPEEEEEEPVASTSNTPPSDSEDETLASSSSTLIPPTPKAQHDHLHPHDLPPAYNQVQDELAVRVANETLKTWHKGLKLPIEPIPGGISEDALEEWKSLKEELGVECSAIDKIVEESTRTGLPRPSKDGRQARRRSRFYNIYNTYVYGGGDKDGSSSPSLLSSSQFLFCLGASAAVAFIVGHSTAPQYHIPGGATYYDRAAWASYNTFQAAGEGFPGEGTSALWGLLGRLGGGAARHLRGWPT